jgi:hypothetical protein
MLKREHVRKFVVCRRGFIAFRSVWNVTVQLSILTIGVCVLIFSNVCRLLWTLFRVPRRLVRLVVLIVHHVFLYFELVWVLSHLIFFLETIGSKSCWEEETRGVCKKNWGVFSLQLINGLFLQKMCLLLVFAKFPCKQLFITENCAAFILSPRLLIFLQSSLILYGIAWVNISCLLNHCSDHSLTNTNAYLFLI